MRTRGPLTAQDLAAVAAFRHFLMEIGPPGRGGYRSPAHAYRIHFALWKMGEPPSVTLRRRVADGALR